MLLITKKQKEIGKYILNYRAVHVYSPTLATIALKFNRDRKTIYDHIKRMQAKGYLYKMTPKKKLWDIFYN